MISKETLRWAVCRVIVLFLYLLLRSNKVFPTVEISLLSLAKFVNLRDCIAKQVLNTTLRLWKLSVCQYGTLVKAILGLFLPESRPWSCWWRADNPLGYLKSDSPITSLGWITVTYPRPLHPSFAARTHLPEPALVFDTLLARGVAVRDNPTQISSLFLHFSALISIDRSGSVRRVVPSVAHFMV